MSPGQLHASSLGRQRKVSRGRSSATLYIVLALIALSLDSVDHFIPKTIRTTAADIVSPLLSLIERPVRGLQRGLERLAGVSDIYMENERLRVDNEKLARWRDAARQMMQENEQLRKMLKVPGREIPIAATARVIGVGGGAFERNFLISAGSSDNVKAEQPVVDDRGLIGRIQELGRWSSRVLLVTDLNSRIPIRLQRTSGLAIAEGQNEDQLRLRFLPVGSDIQVGDIVVTSGHGGMFPPDIPVAQVVSIDRERIMMKPLGLFDKIDHVRVMDYNPLGRGDDNPDDKPKEKAGGS